MNKKYFLFVLIFSVASLNSQTHRQTGALTLQEAVALALKENPEIRAAQKEVAAAEGGILQAGKIPNPEFGITWNEISSLNLGSAGERDIGISQEIEYPSKRSFRIQNAQLEKSITELRVERMKKRVAVRVKQAYFSALLAKTVLANLLEQKKMLEDLERVITDRFTSQAGNYVDVLRMKVEIARLNNDRTEAEREVKRKLNELNLAVGAPGETVYDIGDTLSYHELPLNRDSLIAEMLSQSISLRIAEKEKAYRQNILSASGANYLPDFKISLAQQRRVESGGYNNGLWGIEVNVSVPLWFWQEPKGIEQDASARLDVAVIQQESVERKIRIAVNNAVDAVEAVQSQIAVFNSSLLRDSEDIFATVISQYRNNQTDLVTLFDVYRTYRASKNEYTRTIANYFLAVTELEAAANDIEPE
ncbi:MAG: TolC family protein [Bacteroidetes bacterium]|nr:TolC family protein [Bacteroidota bacterium]